MCEGCMVDDRVQKVFFILLLLIFLVLTFLIIRPFLGAIIIGLIFAGAFRPVYKWLNQHIRNRTLSSAIMVVGIIVIIIIPIFFITTKLVSEATKAYRALGNEAFLTEASLFLHQTLGITLDLSAVARDVFLNIQTHMINIAPDLISSIAEVLLSLFVMFFILFYAFKGGDSFLSDVKELIPLKKHYRIKLLNEIDIVLKGVLYGQVLTAIIQGALGGLLLFAFGVPNSFFWGFIMVILSFLPIVGTPIVWVPAGIYQIASGEPLSGILILIIGGIVVMNVDNLVKPKLISAKSKIHPIIALIGVLGGLALFGLVGIIIGPIIMALFLVLLRFYVQDFKDVLGA